MTRPTTEEVVAYNNMEAARLREAAKTISRDNIHRDKRVAALAQFRLLLQCQLIRASEPILVVVNVRTATLSWPQSGAVSWKLCHLQLGEGSWVTAGADELEWAFRQEPVPA